LGISQMGSVPFPGSGEIELFDIHHDLAPVANATYDSVSFTMNIEGCTIAFSPSLNLSQSVPGDAEGLTQVAVSQLNGPSNCGQYVAETYWQLWSATGDILFVPIDGSTAGAHSTAVYTVNNGSTPAGGTFRGLFSAKDRQIQGLGDSFGSYSAYPPSLSAMIFGCAATYTLVPRDLPNPITPPQEPRLNGPCEKPSLQWQVGTPPLDNFRRKRKSGAFLFFAMHSISRTVRVCVRTYVHTYIHTCIHTYIHTYIHIRT
jgi:hypothetical protein